MREGSVYIPNMFNMVRVTCKGFRTVSAGDLYIGAATVTTQRYLGGEYLGNEVRVSKVMTKCWKI
jgi:hypothetical protein